VSAKVNAGSALSAPFHHHHRDDVLADPGSG